MINDTIPETLSHPWSQQVRQETRLPITSNAIWYYMHHPKNWEFVYFDGEGKNPKGMLIPNLSHLTLEVGVNNVRPSGRGADPSLAILQMQEEGFSILHPDSIDYLRVFPAMGGKFYSDKFTSFEKVGSTLITNFDYESFKQWRRKLVSEGLLNLPHKHFVGLLLKDYQRRIEKYSKAQHIPQVEHKFKVTAKEERDIRAFMKKVAKEGVKAYA